VPKSPFALGRVAAVGRHDLSRAIAVSFWLSAQVPTAENAMSTTLISSSEIPWWKEPTKDQWTAWIAAWLGWTLDAFDFTIFLLIMAPIAESFHVPLIEVTAVFTVTLWLPLVGAVGSGWLADRIGRKTPWRTSGCR